LRSATIFSLVKELYAPHRTGLEDFPHPALQPVSLDGNSKIESSVNATGLLLAENPVAFP
jgi:hypothetical protein